MAEECQNVGAKTMESQRTNFSRREASREGPDACKAITTQVMARLGQTGPEQNGTDLPDRGTCAGCIGAMQRNHPRAMGRLGQTGPESVNDQTGPVSVQQTAPRQGRLELLARRTHAHQQSLEASVAQLHVGKLGTGHSTCNCPMMSIPGENW